MKRAPLLATIALSAACRGELRPPPAQAIAPPVSTPDAIPDAPLSGTLRGAPFVARDARYVVDRRVGYAHTDLRLSAGKADSPCGDVAPSNAPSVWLRLDGPDRIASQELHLAPEDHGAWSVHYQVFDGEQWIGVGEGSALVAIHEAGPDGRVTGGLAVCFADDAKSCLSGSFDAPSCPPRIDEPVRGSRRAEPMPEKR